MKYKECKICHKLKEITDFYKPTVCTCKRCTCKKNTQKVIDRNFNKLFLLLNVNKVTEDSIVVLEGSNFIDNQTSFYNNKDYIHFAVYPQLLSLESSKGNYLIGDRLIEYLTHNAICPLSGLADINRIHDVFKNNSNIFPFKDEEKYKYGY